MFTMEESALLARLLRFAGWVLVCVVLAIATSVVVHRIHLRHAVTSVRHS